MSFDLSTIASSDLEFTPTADNVVVAPAEEQVPSNILVDKKGTFGSLERIPEIKAKVEAEKPKVTPQAESAAPVVEGGITLEKRDSRTSWLPSNHWVAGFAYHHVLRANRENFLYDITGFDGESMQYTSYEKGEYYGWHNDASIEVSFKPTDNKQENFVVTNSEQIRKLSFIFSKLVIVVSA
jgi:hypothetical protein